MTLESEPPAVVETETFRSQLSRILRAKIIAGLLVPEQLYTIRSISQEHDISPTPVREAVAQLAAEGLVTLIRNRGFMVRTLTAHDLDEILQLRKMLEPEALREIATRRLLTDPEPLRAQAHQISAYAADGDLVRFLDTDRDFHLGLLTVLGNGRLVQTVGQLRDHTRLYGLRKVTGREDFQASADEHQQLVDLVAAGEADEAHRLMTIHLDHARGIWAGTTEKNA